MEVTKMRMRTIRETAAYFKRLDPDTAITECAIRRMVRNGKLPYAKAGTKYLVSLDVVSNYFLKGCIEVEENEKPFGVIRPVEVKQ